MDCTIAPASTIDFAVSALLLCMIMIGLLRDSNSSLLNVCSWLFTYLQIPNNSLSRLPIRLAFTKVRVPLAWAIVSDPFRFSLFITSL